MIQRESDEEKTAEMEAEVSEADIETFKQALAEEKEKAEGYLANWQRSQADFINYKRRSEQEKEEINKFAASALMLDLLSILDDLKRAFDSIPVDVENISWADGIRLIGRKLQTGLEAQGLTPIKAVGEIFDPHIHEAMSHCYGEEGIIIEELQKGYTLHDRVLRPSKVVVGNGQTDE